MKLKLNTLANPIDREQKQLNLMLYNAINLNLMKDVTRHIDAGAQVNDRADHNSDYPLLLACEKGDEEMVKLLISKGADVNVNKDFSGNNGRLSASGKPIIRAINQLNFNIVGILLESGADPNTKTGNGKSALMEAITSHDPHDKPLAVFNLVKTLVEAGADFNAVMDDGYSCMVVNSIWFRENVITYLLDQGAHWDPEMSIQFDIETGGEFEQRKLDAFVENYLLNKAANTDNNSETDLAASPSRRIRI